MELLRKLWKTKQAKIGLAVVCIIVILAAAFLLQPSAKTGTGKDSSETLTMNSSEMTKESTTDTTSKTAETKTEDTESTMESQTSSAQEDSESTTQMSASATLENSDGTLSTNSQNTTTTVAPAQANNETAAAAAEENPAAVEQDEVAVDENKQYTCTISIRCDTILNNLEMFNQDKLSILPSDGTILSSVTVTFSEGESVFDVLERVTRERRIHMEYTSNPLYNSAYIEGIYNIYEFDCGSLSGWMYKVNGWFPNYGCNRYVVQNGDVIEFVYTCDLGQDVGSSYSSQQGGS